MEESNFYDLRKQVVQQLRERHYAPLTIGYRVNALPTKKR